MGTETDNASLDGINDSPLTPAELREIRRDMLERRRIGWLKKVGWKWLLALATLAGMVASAASWTTEHFKYHP